MSAAYKINQPVKSAAGGGSADINQAQGCKYCHVHAQKPGSFQLDDLILGMKLCALAYTEDDKPDKREWHLSQLAPWKVDGDDDKFLTNHLNALGFTLDRFFSHSGVLKDLQAYDSQGYIAHNDSDVVIAFRGTNGMTDWEVDVSASKVDFEPLEDEVQGNAGCFAFCRKSNGPRVHQGFYDCVFPAFKDIEELVLPLMNSPTPRRFIVTGHSLGGAMSTIAFGYLLKCFDWAASPHQIVNISAGSPRVGDALFVNWMETEVAKLGPTKSFIARIVHDHDIVPHVPPALFGFIHVRKLCLLSETDLFINPSVEDLKVEGAKDKTINLDLVSDHMPANYHNALLRCRLESVKEEQ